MCMSLVLTSFIAFGVLLFVYNVMHLVMSLHNMYASNSKCVDVALFEMYLL